MPGNLTEVYLQNEFACLHRPVSLPRPKIQILKIITLKPSAWLSKAPQSSFPFWLGSLGAQLSKFQGAPDIQTQPPSWCMSVAPIHQVFCLSPPMAARTLNSYSRNCLLLTDGEVHGDLVHLLLGGGLGQVGVLEVAALHRVKPVHAIPAPGVSSVAGPDNTVSDIIPGDKHHAYEESNPLMSM